MKLTTELLDQWEASAKLTVPKEGEQWFIFRTSPGEAAMAFQPEKAAFVMGTMEALPELLVEVRKLMEATDG